jgi:hypothetical protein
VKLLADLIGRYGPDAVVTARPHLLDSGSYFHWDLEIDGSRVADAVVHVRTNPSRPHVLVMVLVHGDDEIELARWDASSPPGAITRRLGDLLPL